MGPNVVAPTRINLLSPAHIDREIETGQGVIGGVFARVPTKSGPGSWLLGKKPGHKGKFARANHGPKTWRCFSYPPYAGFQLKGPSRWGLLE